MYFSNSLIIHEENSQFKKSILNHPCNKKLSVYIQPVWHLGSMLTNILTLSSSSLYNTMIEGKIMF